MSAEKLAAAIKAIEADTTLKADQKARQIEVLKLEEELAGKNAAMSGIGMRWFAGMTRGKGSMVISWLAFDTSKPETCPKTSAEFKTATGLKTEAEFVERLIIGHNDIQYTAASDPIAEFVNPAWDDDTKLQFKNVVRNYAKATGTSIEETVALVKPGVEKAFAAKAK